MRGPKSLTSNTFLLKLSEIETNSVCTSAYFRSNVPEVKDLGPRLIITMKIMSITDTEKVFLAKDSLETSSIRNLIMRIVDACIWKRLLHYVYTMLEVSFKKNVLK